MIGIDIVDIKDPLLHLRTADHLRFIKAKGDQYPENIVPIIVKNLRTDTIDIVPVLYGSLHTSEFIKCLISSTVLAVMNLIKLRKIKLRFFKI